MCPNDGYVIIRRSEHLCGNLCKTTMAGSKKGILYALIRNYSPHAAAIFMNRVAKLSARWLANRGFSIGIDDVTPGNQLIMQKVDMLKNAYVSCEENIMKWKKGQLEASPGMTEEEYLESILNGTLSKIREALADRCFEELDRLNNAPLIMSTCGSKGSPNNISQMVASVGQQTLNNSRIPNGFENRALPQFEKHSRRPLAKGFVENSFYSGLTGTEFFFHTMTGREGLIDTAVKTADTGYMQRRLIKTLEDICVGYDKTVRTAEGRVVQFIYGDDGLDPSMMADGINPVVFSDVWHHVCAQYPSRLDDPMINSEEMIRLVKKSKHHFGKNWSKIFFNKLVNFVKRKADDLQSTIKSLQIVNKTKNDHKTNNMLSSSQLEIQLHQFGLKITKKQYTQFLQQCQRHYQCAKMDPCTAVGALAAQSLGEPTTQMTLKTFHFAGLASMNITMGVPRIKEIINATAKISTPIIKTPLEESVEKNLTAVRIVKGRIGKTILSDVTSYISTIYSATKDCCLKIKLNLDCINRLQLPITPHSVCASIISNKQCKKFLKKDRTTLHSSVHTKGNDTVIVLPSEGKNNKNSLLFSMQLLNNILPDVVVCGLEDTTRAVIQKKQTGEGYELMVEGTNLLGVIGIPGVKGTEVISNHIKDVAKYLGIEAARKCIMTEMSHTFGEHGLTVDYRHIALLGDVMTFHGQVLGSTLHGVEKMKESVLMLGSFEKTTEHLCDAAMRGTLDTISGVSDSIIMGLPMQVGTGRFDILYNAKDETKKTQNLRPLLLG